MDAATVGLFCFQGGPPGGDTVVQDVQTLDLGQPTNFVAWLQIDLVYGIGSGPWDFDNAFLGEVLQVDGVEQPVEATGGVLGGPGDFNNFHSIAVRGFGQHITFRLRVRQPEEMQVHGTGIVLFNL
jgi:hypothetical protein